MHKIIDTLLQTYPIPDKPIWKTTINVANIETSNNVYNKVPDAATVYLDIRYTAEENNTIVETIKKHLPSDAFIEIEKNYPAPYTDEKNMYVTSLKRTAEQVLGNKVDIRGAHGGSEVKFYTDVNSAAVEFGPIGSGAHADSEWVDIQSLEDYYHILKNFLLSVKA